MASVNKVFLLGNLTKDPELRYTAGGTAVANINLAMNRTYIQNGEKKEDVSFVRVTVWGKQAEAAGEYLKKGQPCHVEGRLQSKSWEKDGHKQYGMDVVAERVQFLSGGRGGSRPSDETQDQSAEASSSSEEDIPF